MAKSMRGSSVQCIDALLAAASDGADNVRDQIIGSLRIMAGKNIESVLHQCEQWLTNRKASTTPHLQRYIIMKSLCEILRAHASPGAIPSKLLGELINCSIREMTEITDFTSDWARESSTLAVILCELDPQSGCCALINPIESSALPHYFILQTLADFAISSPLRFLPYLKDAMGKILPLLSLAKQDNHRMVFANALAAFSDAVLQLANKNEELTPRSASSATLKKADFSESMFSCLNFIMQDWTRVSEQRVRGPVLHAVGSMSAVLNTDMRVAMLPKSIPLFINGMKRERPVTQVPVTKGFANMFFQCEDEVVVALQAHVEAVLQCILQNVVQSTGDKDCNESNEIRQNISFLSLAAENIATAQMSNLMTFLSKTLDAKSGTKEPGARAGCLLILRHLITRRSLDPRLEPHKDGIIATVKLAAADTDWRVRRAVVSCVIAMGASELPFFSAVGGFDLVEYVIKNAGIWNSVIEEFRDLCSKKKEMLLLGTSPDEIRTMCRNTLSLFTASNNKLDDLLWPDVMDHFNKHVVDPELVNAFVTISRCLVQLAKRKETTDTYYVDFAVKVNLPKPQHIAVKFITQAMQFQYYSREELWGILSAMESIAPLLDEPFLYQHLDEPPTPIATLWLSTVPQLVELLNQEGTTASDWEDVMCRFATKTAGARQTEEWSEQVGSAAMAQLPTYKAKVFDTMFRSCSILIGISVGKCSRKDFALSALDCLVDTAAHDNVEHQHGLAKAFSFMSQTHPDAVIEKLALLAKGPEKRGFFASKDPKKKEFLEVTRSIAAEGLCSATKKLQQSILTSRLEASIMPILSTILTECKERVVREAVFHSIPMMESSIKKLKDYVFKSRDALIDQMLTLIHVDTKQKVIFNADLLSWITAGIKAITSLIRTSQVPQVAPALQEKILAHIPFFIQRDWTADPKHDCEVVAIDVFSNLIQALVNHAPFVPINTIGVHIHDWTANPQEGVRQRALSLYISLLQHSQTRLEAELQSEAQSISNKHREGMACGMFIGRLVPRYMDANPALRQLAGKGIALTLQSFSMLYPELFENMSMDATISELEAVTQRAIGVKFAERNANTEKEIANVTKLLCGFLVAIFSKPEDFCPLVETLLSFGLIDCFDPSANCSCIVLHGMIRGLGGSLAEPTAKMYLEQMVAAISQVSHREQSLNGVLLSIRNLAKHHSVLSFNTLLKYEAPHNNEVIKGFQAVGNDATLAKMLLLHCLDSILNSQLIEDRPDPKIKQKITHGLNPVPLSAASAFGWVCQVAKGAEVATTMRIPILCTQFLYLTMCHEIGNATAVKVVAQSIQFVALSTTSELTQERMERYGWHHFLHPTFFLVAMNELCKYISREEVEGDTGEDDRTQECLDESGLSLDPCPPTPTLLEIAEFILPYNNKPIRSHRRAAINISAILLFHALGDNTLLQSVVTGLLGRCGSDEEPMLRGEALLNFTNIVVHPYDTISVYVSPILSALLSNFDDGNLQVAIAAMGTLNVIVTTLTNKIQVAAIVVNIILKVKSLFEHPEGRIRSACFQIFSVILNMANDGLLDRSTIDQQVHLHLHTMIVHAEDVEVSTRQASKKALAEAALFLAKHSKSEEMKSSIQSVFDKPHMQPANKTRFDEFMNDFCFMWVVHYPGRVSDLLLSTVTFFDSPHESLRSAAITLCGYMLRHLPGEELSRAHIDQVCQALLRRLDPNKERSPLCRAKAARSVGMIKEL